MTSAFFAAATRLVELGLRGCFPLERDAAAGAIAGMGIFEDEVVQLGVVEIDGERGDLGEVHHRWRGR